MNRTAVLLALAAGLGAMGTWEAGAQTLPCLAQVGATRTVIIGRPGTVWPATNTVQNVLCGTLDGYPGL